jgi:PPOX class probable F420-dependent enzyme
MGREPTYLYLTTYSTAGRPGTVPVWFMRASGDVLYFTTRRDSLKARRIRANGRVTVRIGAKDAPAREGHAEWVDERPDLEQAVLVHYGRKYWLMVPLWMGRYIRKGLAAKTSVLVRVTLASQ